MYVWPFKVLVNTTSGYFVETTYDYECSEEEFGLLEKARDEHADIRFDADLADTYATVCWLAANQEFKRYLNWKEYEWVEDFDEECELTVSL